MSVIIGVDPHKATHTAVAIGQGEDELGRMRVRATRRQVAQLLAWAEPFEKRTWAIESAGGLGYLLAQQLVTAGLEGAGPGLGLVEQERPQRCRIGGCGCSSGSCAALGGAG